MKHYYQHSLLLVSFVLLQGCLADDDAPNPDLAEEIDPTDRYIISLKPGVPSDPHVSMVNSLHGSNNLHRGLLHPFDILGFCGYTGHFNASFIEDLKKDKDIALIEHDQPLTVTRQEIQYDCPNYGPGQISRRSLMGGGAYVYDDSAGQGMYAYILDSGINAKHVDFEGRAKLGHLAIGASSNLDHTGHGTQIAGIIGSKTYGVAKKANLIAVKVTNDDRTLMGIAIKGYEWAVKDVTKRRRQASSVINISMNGPRSDALVSSINMAASKNIATVVGAGNDNRDVSTGSPSNCRGAIVVAATTKSRARAHFSNYGRGVTLHAPGVGIMSTYIGPRNNEKRAISGTSAASAHVAGLVLYFKKLKPRVAGDVLGLRSYLGNIATTQAVGDVKSSPNKFAYNDSGK